MDSGLGVYNKPVEDVLVKYVNKNQVKNISGESFQEVEKAIALGSPVWVIKTIDFMPAADMEAWPTRQGIMEITYSMHSVVVVGYDQDFIYLNDPYGEKDYRTDKENFIAAWKQMGSQGIYIEK
ncbi:C39 family peptidase [endosymbiont 'TC1' of Trimyema compressum]|uniref:C39 family peptidase n=1 Tax=endosymbiont 'TC1' of Trimyema compressum TaxID=243899 RepID=UPI002480C1B4|nr:C39 family peptidase [endosymbiont 'TC1' of Trimyema compressum]